MESNIDDEWIESGRGELLLLFNYWYDTKKFPRKKLTMYTTSESNNSNVVSSSSSSSSFSSFRIDASAPLPASHLRRLWRSVWFAKGEAQAAMDKHLLQFEAMFVRFEGTLKSVLLRQYGGEMMMELNSGTTELVLVNSNVINSGEVGTFQSLANPSFRLANINIDHPLLFSGSSPLLFAFDARIALMILFDQVSRNIFRAQPQAYQYDAISRGIALGMISRVDEWNTLAIQYKLTVLICLLHTEELAVQKLVRCEIEALIANDSLSEYLEMTTRLKEIAFNHYDRVLHFGRIPERNSILGRESTEREALYLSGIGKSYFMDL
jgi:uncharacterized protein (DUF924 family)